MRLDPGTRFDRYQIVSLIGRGGMGEVYLATDTRLGRKVALKLLPAQYTQDAERLRRFEQEAQAASALNHPNIVTIYEVGEAEGRPFIATEYIEGVTLRGRMTGRRMPIPEALDIASQVVSALAAAHAAGIVHRDIKPENIMVRPDGYVKVLDFGLAKLTERTGAEESSAPVLDTGAYRIASTGDAALHETSEHAIREESAAEPPAPTETAPGVVMGTAQYMSPEQARGLRVDARTDIFSLGIVLYEMLAGKTPFPGSLSREIIDAILRTDPAPLSAFNPEVPEVVEWIVAKALVKDRDERYQSSKEMLNDLKRLSRRLNVESEMERARTHASGTDSRSGSRSPRYSGDTTQEVAAETKFGTAAHAPARLSSGGFFKQMVKDSRGANQNRPLIIALAIALVLVGGLSAVQFLRSRRQSPAPFQSMRVARFTTSGKAGRAAISPDGKYVAYAQGEIGKQGLYVRQVLQSNAIEVVPAANVIYRGLTFSRDATSVYYVVQEGSDPIQVLYQVPVLGGTPRKILTDIDSPVAISPDLKSYAFIRRYRGKNEDALILAFADGKPERKLATRGGNDFFGISGLEWSPDGKSIVCAAGTNKGRRQMYVAMFNMADGAELPVSPQRWANVGRLAWLQDGRGLVMSAVEQGSTLSQLWQMSYPKGDARRITNDLNDYRDLSMTSSSRALVTVQSEAQVDVWLLAGPELSRARKITEGIGQYNGVRGLTWMPDGRLLYVSRVSGSQDLWLMNQEGKEPRQLTTAETRADIYPAVSPDGKHIVFVSTRTGNSNLYRYDLATGEQHQLTNGASEEFPAITPDGRTVVYTETGALKFTLWRVDIDGGTPVQLTEQLSSWPVVSPDGQRIACWYRESPKSSWRIAILPINGGSPERIYEAPTYADASIPVRWSPDGQGLCFVGTRDGVSNIWLRPLAEGGEPRRLTNFDSAQIFWFDWSRDGRQLACSRGVVTSDVVLISDFKP